jgi:prepilin-type N-terminal cleavage/methylation domain-containing protein
MHIMTPFTPVDNLRFASRSTRKPWAGFTLIELLVVIAIIAILAAMLIPVLASTKQKAYRINCTSNLHQLAIGWTMYSSDFNALMPCNWPGVCSGGVAASPTASLSSPWRTHEIWRDIANTSTMDINSADWGGSPAAPPWNLGLLWANNFIGNGQVFYCPAGIVPAVDENMTYAYYTTPTAAWPTVTGPDAVAAADIEVRVAYDYWPQSRNLVPISAAVLGPKPALVQSDLDLTKCIMTDQMQGYDDVAHKASGFSGVNALFGDTHVAWESAATIPKAFELVDVGTSGDTYAWGKTSATGSIGESTGATTFRYVKSILTP